MRTARPLVISFFCLSALLLVGCQGPPSSVTASSSPGLAARGYVSKPVVDGSATLVQPLPSSLRAQVTFVLKPPHRDELQQLVRDLSDPNSPRFRQFLTFEEWKERYAPSDADVDAVAAWAKSQGLTEVHRFASNQALVVEGDVATIQHAFSVGLNQYEAAGRQFFANDRAPTLPATLVDRINDVLGLSSWEQVHPANGHATRAADMPAPGVAPGPFRVVAESHGDAAPRETASAVPLISNGKSVLEPADIWSSQAYDFRGLQKLSHCCNLNNAPGGSPRETSIAIIGNDRASQSDYQAFFSNYKLAYNVTETYFNGATCCNSNSQELTMDVEWAGAMSNSFGSSSQTAHIYLYEGGGGTIRDTLHAWQQALSDNNARVASSSFGANEGDYGSVLDLATPSISDFTDVTNAMVAQGWTIVVAAGDDGATADQKNFDTVQYPASDPNVVAAGGTTLTMSGTSAATLAYASETTWSGNGINNNGGGGGGCSNTFWSPWWQGSTGGCPDSGGFRRAIPDISLNARNLQAFYYLGQWANNGGGTSIVAPELAGFFAQANSYLMSLGSNCGNQHNAACGPIGNPGPAIYYAVHAAHDPFYDITSGCNGGVNTTGFCAGPGYDKATGWGSANMLQLAWAINDFINAPGSTAPTVTFTSAPPTNTWYSTDQLLLVNASGATMGVAGLTAAWDHDPGDPSSHATPGSGDPFWDGPLTIGSSGGLSLQAAGYGCHTAYVRAWDNDGKVSSVATYGPVCYVNCSGGLGSACGDSLALTQSSVSLTAGDTMSVPLEVTIGKCSPMQLSVSATPSGISAQTSQASVSATGQYYLYLGVANTVAPESTTITVTGTCGLGSASTSVQLQTLACMPQACWSGECGAADDGCGHTIQCGGCPTGQSCVNHACVTPGGGNCGTPQQCCTKNGCRWSSGHCICI